MEIHPESPLNLLSEILVPIDFAEVDDSELKVLQSFIQKTADYGWYKKDRGSYYYSKKATEDTPFLIYFIPRNCHMELRGHNQNFSFISDVFRVSMPRSFFKLNEVFEDLYSVILDDFTTSNNIPYTYRDYVDSLGCQVTESGARFELPNNTELIINEHELLNQIIIKRENLLWSATHHNYWCNSEKYWLWLSNILRHGFEL